MYCILLALNFKCIINSNKVAPQCTPDLKDTDESYDVGRWSTVILFHPLLVRVAAALYNELKYQQKLIIFSSQLISSVCF